MKTPNLLQESVDQAELIISNEITRVRQTLIRKMKSFSLSLASEAAYLERNPEYFANSLGIVQNEGLDLDRLCVSLAEKRGHLKLIQKANNGRL